MWLAGGGIKGGQVVGKTDDLGFNIVEDKVHVHDLQATMLHCLGFDHTRLTYRYMGRDFRLDGCGGERSKQNPGLARRSGQTTCAFPAHPIESSDGIVTRHPTLWGYKDAPPDTDRGSGARGRDR